MEKSEEKGLRSRVFEVVSSQITEELIEDALESHKIIKKYAWICHDKDQYTQADERKNPEHKAGTLKTSHHHVVLQLSTAAYLKDVAKWFGVAENFVEIPKGNDKYKFLDKVGYLPHDSEKEQTKGKYRYPDDAVHANFDWRAELDARDINKVKYGKQEVTAKERMRYAVLVEGKTLRECDKENPLLYSDDIEKLRKLRGEYLAKCAPPPFRMNFFVEGKGGMGKGLLSRALARMLFPGLEDDDIFFEVGENGAGFLGYDGQPVVIWHDKRSYELLKLLGGRGNVFNVFDTFPSKGRQNVKYSSVNLINAVNIVDADQSYTEFLDGLAGEYTDRDGNFYKAEDKSQSYRRFPMMFVLHEEDYDMLINKGFLHNTREFEQFIKYNHIRGSFARIHQVTKNPAIRQSLAEKALAPAVQEYNKLMEQVTGKEEDEAAIAEMMEQYGTMPQEVVYVQEGMEVNKEGYMVVTEEMMAELPFE